MNGLETDPVISAVACKSWSFLWEPLSMEAVPNGRWGHAAECVVSSASLEARHFS